MLYYIVNKIGTGPADDPFRPDVPEGLSCVGSDFGDTFLIGTDVAITGLTPLTDSELQSRCTSEGILYTDVVNKWFVT